MKHILALIFGVPLLDLGSALQLSDDFGYPMHDSFIAAGALTESQSLSLSDMTGIIKATHGDADAERFVSLIPEILAKAMKKRNTDLGRVAEYTDEKDLQIGDNYVLDIKSVTLSCVITEPITLQLHSSGMAYASHVLAVSSSKNIQLDSPDPRAYNLTMLLEADVMELPLDGFMFVPKRYCLDVQDEYDPGVSSGGSTGSSTGIYSTIDLVRSLRNGVGLNKIRPIANRVRWLDRRQSDTKYKMVQRAYEQPKAELIAYVNAEEASQEKLCESPSESIELLAKLDDSTFSALKDFNNVTQLYRWNCLISETLSQLKKLENTTGGGVRRAFTAISQGRYMNFNLEEWFQPKYEAQNAVTDSEKDAIREFFSYDSPVLFDPAVAATFKNSMNRGFQVNPYWNEASLAQLLQSCDDEKMQFLEQCVQEELSSTSESACPRVSCALKRRLYEHLNEPMNQPDKWSHYNIDEKDVYHDGGAELVLSNNVRYLSSQNVSWAATGKHEYSLQPGDLTNKKLGRTAQYVMTSSWEDRKELQDLLEAQRDSDVYSQVASDAVAPDNPCGKAASNSEIFLFVLAMATAAFGGVEGVIQRLQASSSWWKSVYYIVGYRSVQSELSDTEEGEEKEDQQEATPESDDQAASISRFWCIVGVVVFICLYVPLLLQTITEYEVSNFHTQEVEFEVHYRKIEGGVPIYDGGTYSTFVTLVEAETRCENARPELFTALLLVGFIIGAITNAELFYGAFRCGCCCIIESPGTKKPAGQKTTNPPSSIASESGQNTSNPPSIASIASESPRDSHLNSERELPSAVNPFDP